MFLDAIRSRTKEDFTAMWKEGKNEAGRKSANNDIVRQDVPKGSKG